MQKNFLIINIVLMVSVFIGCSSSEVGESRDVSQDKIYQAYTVSFSEVEKKFNILAQFRFAGPDGTTLVLTQPSNFALNGNRIAVDSNSFQGAFYATVLSSSSALQEQVFVFTDLNSRKYENHFLLKKFNWLNPPQKVSVNKNLILAFDTDPLRKDEYIEISTSGADSSFSIRYSSTDTGNKILISSGLLRKQTCKKLMLTGTVCRKTSLTQATSEGGIINSYYESTPITILLSQ